MSTSDLEEKVDSLIRDGRAEEAEALMLQSRSEFEQANDLPELKLIVKRLAHFYATPGTKDRAKGEACFLELERLSPGSYSKYQTAMFYFYSLNDYEKVISKTDEIVAGENNSASYYSALALKGLSFVKLGQMSGAGGVLDEMLKLANSNSEKLPYGDEMNLAEATSSVEELKSRSLRLLSMVVPKIGDRQFLRRGERLLKSIAGAGSSGK